MASKEVKNGEKAKWLFKAIAEHDSDDFLIFPFKLMEVGYGSLSINSKVTYAHWVACEYRNGPRPPKHQAAHECGKRSCVNPRHLSWKTVSANQMDRVRHGTSNRGESHPLGKLTESDVWIIVGMARFPHTNASIGRSFGINPEQVRRIKTGERWGWLTGNKPAGVISA